MKRDMDFKNVDYGLKEAAERAAFATYKREQKQQQEKEDDEKRQQQEQQFKNQTLETSQETNRLTTEQLACDKENLWYIKRTFYVSLFVAVVSVIAALPMIAVFVQECVKFFLCRQ